MCSRPRPPYNCPPVARQLSVGLSVIGTLLGRQEATGPVLKIESTRIGNFGCSQISKISVLIFFRPPTFPPAWLDVRTPKVIIGKEHRISTHSPQCIILDFPLSRFS